MEKKYCCVTNKLTSFKLPYVHHFYDKNRGEIILIMGVETAEETRELMYYASFFSEIVRGGSLDKKCLISNIVIKGKNNSICFNGCTLLEIKFPDDLIETEGNYEVMLTFIEVKTVKKLYLSGPMSLCKDEATWKANFQKYEDIFTKKGYNVVNPAKNPILPTYEECLKHSLQQEMECDCIFFMPNSILSTGARLEYEIAKACGIEIVVIDDDISMTDNYENSSGIKCKNK